MPGIDQGRELSQFGNFLYVDNSSGNISISTTTTPNIGIGTTNPTYKLHVIGNTNISGFLTATKFFQEGVGELINPTVDRWSGTGDIYRLTGNVGVGTSSIQNKFEVLGNARIIGILTVTNGLNVNNTVTSISNISASTFISTVTTGTAPFQVNSTTQVNNLNSQYLGGKTAPTGNIVGTTDSQNLQGKSLEDSSTLFYDNLNNTKQFRFELSGISTSTVRIITIPDQSGTLVVTGLPSCITGNMITDLEITNSDIAVGASIAYSKLNLSNSIVNNDIVNGTIQNVKLVNNTISSVGLGSTLRNLNFGAYLTASGSYNGSSIINVSVAATSTNVVGDTIVARDANGNFTASVITATDFNSTSDINLKENIQNISPPLNKIELLNGVRFSWKKNKNVSYGVIAQELEKIYPELVNITEEGIKTVNYNGLIAILIEAIKELRYTIDVSIKDLYDKYNKLAE